MKTARVIPNLFAALMVLVLNLAVSVTLATFLPNIANRKQTPNPPDTLLEQGMAP